jgi:hypothetical protein
MTIEQAIKQYENSERMNKELAETSAYPTAKAYYLESAEKCRQMIEWFRELQERRKAPKIVWCKNCIYYDPPHVENNGVRYEYTEMPADAFDVLGTGLVTTEYGINVGGRCCRDYNAGYDDDKRVYVQENNFCGRAERRTE